LENHVKFKKELVLIEDQYLQKKRIKRCKWSQKSKTQRQVHCCKFTVNCKINHKTKVKKCLKRGKQCLWIGKIIVSKRIRTCTLKAFGKKGVRRHRCSFIKVCKNKRCRHKDIRCAWQGCPRYQKLKYSCGFIHKKKNTIQKQCCSWKETSQCKRKSSSRKVCRFFGKPITTISKSGCIWTLVGGNTRIKTCCVHQKQCSGNKCKRTRRCAVEKNY